MQFSLLLLVLCLWITQAVLAFQVCYTKLFSAKTIRPQTLLGTYAEKMEGRGLDERPVGKEGTRRRRAAGSVILLIIVSKGWQQSALW